MSEMQPTLFELPKKPRAKSRVMMHVTDAGPGECSDGAHLVIMECRRCGHETDWFEVQSTTEGKRGKPCPKCNKESNEYRIATVVDIAERIPADRIDAFLADLRNWALNRRRVIEAIEQLAQPPVELAYMIWIDDGKNDLVFQLENQHGA